MAEKKFVPPDFIVFDVKTIAAANIDLKSKIILNVNRLGDEFSYAAYFMLDYLNAICSTVFRCITLTSEAVFLHEVAEVSINLLNDLKKTGLSIDVVKNQLLIYISTLEEQLRADKGLSDLLKNVDERYNFVIVVLRNKNALVKGGLIAKEHVQYVDAFGKQLARLAVFMGDTVGRVMDIKKVILLRLEYIKTTAGQIEYDKKFAANLYLSLIQATPVFVRADPFQYADYLSGVYEAFNQLKEVLREGVYALVE